MNKCKKCNTQLVIIPPCERLQEKATGDFWCRKCQKYYEKNEIKIEPDYITLCPYCYEYLCDCDYTYCCYCGKKLIKPLIKEWLQC